MLVILVFLGLFVIVVMMNECRLSVVVIFVVRLLWDVVLYMLIVILLGVSVGVVVDVVG